MKFDRGDARYYYILFFLLSLVCDSYCSTTPPQQKKEQQQHYKGSRKINQYNSSVPHYTSILGPILVVFFNFRE
jgi:hypothetical protein